MLSLFLSTVWHTKAFVINSILVKVNQRTKGRKARGWWVRFPSVAPGTLVFYREVKEVVIVGCVAVIALCALMNNRWTEQWGFYNEGIQVTGGHAEPGALTGNECHVGTLVRMDRKLSLPHCGIGDYEAPTLLIFLGQTRKKCRSLFTWDIIMVIYEKVYVEK